MLVVVVAVRGLVALWLAVLVHEGLVAAAGEVDDDELAALLEELAERDGHVLRGVEVVVGRAALRGSTY